MVEQPRGDILKDPGGAAVPIFGVVEGEEAERGIVAVGHGEVLNALVHGQLEPREGGEARPQKPREALRVLEERIGASASGDHVEAQVGEVGEGVVERVHVRGVVVQVLLLARCDPASVDE